MIHRFLATAFSGALILTCFLSFSIRNVEASVNLKITIEGVEGELEENIRAYLSIERQKDHPDMTPQLVRKLHKNAPGEIRKALQPFGYYNPKIETDLTHKNSLWHALYKIETGPAVVIDIVDLSVTGEGADTRDFKELVNNFPIKKGDTLNHQEYEESKQLLHDTALRSGFLKSETITGRIKVYPGKNIAEINISFNTGPQFYFGDVRFIQDVFKPEFLASFIPFKKGDRYTPSRLLVLQNALYNTDYFESVEVRPLVERVEEQEVPIEIELVPRKRNQYTAGIGYGTDMGIRGSLGWENRRVTRTGHSMRAKIQLSEIKSSFTTEYSIPMKNPRTDNLMFTTGWALEDTTTSESEKFLGGVRYNHRRNKWKESIYINYEYEDFDVGSVSGKSTLLIPGISWTRIQADSPVSPKDGWRIYFDVKGAHEIFLSDSSFMQMRSQLKAIHSITSRSRLLFRGEIGTSLVSGFSELPPSVRFFAGGDNSVRGYEYNSLGPEDRDDKVVGGRHLVVSSLEFEQNIWKDWGVAIFYDIGNAVDSLSEKLMKGTGIGVRWKSPVGPIRVDLAFPLDESEEDWRVHFVMGPDL